MWLVIVLISSLWIVGDCEARSPVRALRQHCASGADCDADMCCHDIAESMIGGRRRSLFPQGQCFPMGTIGSYCQMSVPSGKPISMVYTCPCETGLQCVGKIQFDAQFGESGRCE